MPRPGIDQSTEPKEELVTISRAELERLKNRIRKMAADKSYLQLIVKLMNQVSASPGLDNTIEALLRNILDVIGGTNIIIYYFIDKDIHYSDVYGKKVKLDIIDDELVKNVFETREPMEIEEDFTQTKMMTQSFSEAYTWIVPLAVGSDFIGVFKMESMNFAVRDLYHGLTPFFNYAALVIKNEIQGHTKLKKAYDQISLTNKELIKEISQRKFMEEALNKLNIELEKRVDERTLELFRANEKLQKELVKRKKTKKEIQRLKNYLANIIDSMPSILVGMDNQEIVTQWNREAETTTGISADKALGKPVSQVLPDFSSWIKTLNSEISKHHPAVMEKILLEKNGERHFHDLMLYPLETNGVEGAVLRIEDVTERTRIQEMMVQTEKMMSVGGLAAGMAHEINNPLGIIAQAAQNIERRVSPQLPANQRVAEELEVDLESVQNYFEKRQILKFISSIREAVARAAKIVSNMLQFSRRSPETMQYESLEKIMNNSVELAASDYDLKKKYDFRTIEIKKEFSSDMPEILVLTVEIEQVILNLLKNAAQAMTDNLPGKKPEIILRIYKQDRYAVMEVKDNGPGMTEDVRIRVFEPFFTTKKPGIGTGLGLSVSYMIITNNHKGLMEVKSSLGKGTCFTVKLPL